MDALYSFWTGNKKRILFCAGVCVLAGIWYFIMFCGQSNNGAPISEAIRDSEQARDNIQGASKQLDNVEHRLEQSQERVNRVQERVNASEAGVNRVIERNEGGKELVAESIKLSAEARGILEGLPRTNEKSN